ncbi:hypothetical protein [Thalassobius sp. MITS945101]|uniref:hypothetical protein n=1 Tax=Thalassobius sp. MITS945101 TaxID=3096994 RepID=UPI00399AAE6F
MKNERQKTDVEFDQLLSEALKCEVDEERLMRHVRAGLAQPDFRPAFMTGIAQLLGSFPMRWPATAVTACLLTAFSIGLFLPIDPAASNEAEVIAFAFGDPAALNTSGQVLQQSFWR